jgi:hypothetical protein
VANEPDPNEDASFLFLNARADLKKLQTDAKKLTRAVKRAEWWGLHSPNRAQPTQQPKPPNEN